MSERIRDFPTGWDNGVENDVTSPSTQDIIKSAETIIGYGAGSTHTLGGFTGA